MWPSETASGRRNMALDEAAMGPARTGDIVFRVYGWRPGCVSLGRNQPTAETLGGRSVRDLAPGRDVVRRPTGGRSVYHGPELTYAFTAPDRLLGGPRGIHRGVHGALAKALRALGVPIDEPGAAARAGGPIPVDVEECFVDPAPGEITAAGRKLVGSAQWRHRGAILQHGSILVRNEQHRATVSGEGGGAAIGLADVCGTPPSIGALGDALVEAIAGLAGLPVSREDAPPEVETAAAALENRYRSAEWTWRR